MPQRARAAIAFVVLFLLYQSAEGIGDRVLHSFAAQATLMTACVLAAWPLSRWLGFRGYGAWALDARPASFAWLGVGLALALSAKAMALWIGVRMGIYGATAGVAAQSAATVAAALPMLLLSTFVPSIAEDIVTRGFWYRGAGIAWRRGIAFVAFSSLAYVANHVFRLDLGAPEWTMLACFGIAYATALWRTGTLWAAVGLHWGWNLGNHLGDAFVPLDIADPVASPLLSAAVHLVLAGAILLMTRGVAGKPQGLASA
ncbi:MAG TPA: CPBP family intramembrane glutamic endopeptidase [Luteimonas sp.]|jgi:membrane protease YdiL (CAAX protease family)|nr:CPBP family intramembrane glutamic endopeptidase [Luteimonas sp.]